MTDGSEKSKTCRDCIEKQARATVASALAWSLYKFDDHERCLKAAADARGALSGQDVPDMSVAAALVVDAAEWAGVSDDMLKCLIEMHDDGDDEDE